MSKKLSDYGLFLQYRTNKKIMSRKKKGSATILTWSKTRELLKNERY